MEDHNIQKVTKSPQERIQKLSQASFEELYLKKDFKAAINYLLQNKQQMNSGIFHYNLGTAYAKLEDYPAARFHFEKAIKDGYVNTSSFNNLNFVKTKLQVEDISTSNNFFDGMMNGLLSIPSSGYLTMTLLLLIISMLIVRVKRIFNYWALFVILLVSLTPILFFSLYLEQINYAIAFKETSVFEGPSKIFQEKGKLKAGSKVILGDFKEGWFFIKNPESNAGWVNKEQIGIY